MAFYSTEQYFIQLCDLVEGGWYIIGNIGGILGQILFNAFKSSTVTETLLFSAVPAEGAPQKQIMALPNAKIGFSKAMTLGWLKIDKKAEGGQFLF